MSKLNRKQLRKMLLREFKMIGMGSPHMGMIGHSPYQDMDHGSSSPMKVHKSHGGHKGALSMEDCCKAVLCLIECCDCEVTRAKIQECCEEILASC